MSSLRELEKQLTAIWMERQPAEASTVAHLLDDQSFDEKGAKLYARLIGYGHIDVLTSIYPYCQKVLNRKWESVIKAYVQKFPPDHYHLNSSARRFPEFLKDYDLSLLEKFPFLPELADYEWLEMEILEIDTTIDTTPKATLDQPEAFTTLIPLLNQTLQIRTYTYPIQQIVDLIEDGKGFRKKFKPETSHVAMFRDPESHRVRIMELGDDACVLLSEASNSTYGDLARRAVELAPNHNPQSTITDFIDLIEDFHSVNLIVGERKVGI